MKIIICIIFLVFINAVSSQNKFKEDKKIENKILSKSPQLSDDIQMHAIVQVIIQLYSTSFKYFSELRTGHYQFEKAQSETKGKNKADYFLTILSSEAQPQVIDKIALRKVTNNFGNEEIIFDKNEMDKFINQDEFYHKNGADPRSHSIYPIVRDNNILYDKMILQNENIQEQDWRILNRNWIYNNFKNQNDEHSVLFDNVLAGAIIPMGSNSKILTIDRGFHSIIYFDYDFPTGTQYINDYYGVYGGGLGEFSDPTGIGVGRMFTLNSTKYFPVFVTDNHNFRIVKVNYTLDQNNVGTFDNSSFKALTSANFPYDISYFKNLVDTTDDKIWISEANYFTPYISCYNTSGKQLQRFYGYKDMNNSFVYLFQQGMRSRLKTYNEYFGALAFIDDIRNNLVCCHLESNGLAGSEPYLDGFIIRANDVENFPNDQHINSVSFQKTSFRNSSWPYVWVTSSTDIHCLKMDAACYVQYTGSTYNPTNTWQNFSNLINTVVTNDNYNLFTIEQWSQAYGVREYFPYADIKQHTDTLKNYCNDSSDVMRFEASFTNDCWIYLKAFRKNKSNGWDIAPIRKYDGAWVNADTLIIYQFAGWNQSDISRYIDLQLDLPIEDYVLGDSIKLWVKVFPENMYPDLSNSLHIDKEYNVWVQRSCLPRPGGCPFLYLKNATDSNFVADNNVLDKSEYSGSADISDKYKLINTPQIIGNNIALSLIENEHDNGYINMVKLYAVDFPANRKLAVTDGNVIVLYDSIAVVASDSVILNHSINVTSNVNYFNPGTPINRNKNDTLYAHFQYGSYTKLNSKNVRNNQDRKNENIAKDISKVQETKDGPGGPPPKFAFIANVGNLLYPIASAKDTGGVLTAHSIFSNTVTKMFARREKSSVVVLPLFGDTNKVNDFTIGWQDDYQMKYLGIATL